MKSTFILGSLLSLCFLFSSCTSNSKNNDAFAFAYRGVKYQYAEEVVKKIYKNYLKREADPAGLEQWTAILEKKMNTIVEIEKEFIFSGEYQQHAMMDKEKKEQIRILYRDIKGGEIAPDKLAKYLSYSNMDTIVDAIFVSK